VRTLDDAAPSALAAWGRTLTCYTSALAVDLAAAHNRWWRPLLDGAPHLAVSRGPNGLFRFEHHPRPPARLVGLRARGADDWDTGWAGLQRELDLHGRVIVAADTWNVPWSTGHGRRHGPHWFVLARDAARGYVVDDPLELVDGTGRQSPVRLHLNEHDLPGCTGALQQPEPAHVLREEAALGSADAAWGAAYRWLERCEPVVDQPRAPDGHAALELAADLERAADDPAVYEQADDVWQALRQREMLVRALEVESKLGGFCGTPALDPWEHVVELWRRLPPLLMHGQMLARAGVRGRSTEALVETFRQIAAVESELANERFPLVTQ
jgi:hypothetical protein